MTVGDVSTRRTLFVGLSTLDVIHVVAAPPGRNEKVTATRQFVAAGGPAANAAVTFAALGGDPLLVTSVGVGPVADLIRGDLQRFGVVVKDVNSNSRRAGDAAVSAILLDRATGERSVVSMDGAATQVSAPVGQEPLFDDALAVLIDGHHPDLALWAAHTAKAANIPVILDAGRWRPVFADLLPLCDTVICSADFRVPGSADSQESADHVRQLGVMRVAVSRGPDSILWWEDDEHGSVEVPSVNAVDTLGAGDALHGAFAFAALDEGLSFADQLRAAAKVAALRCSILGPRSWLDAL